MIADRQINTPTDTLIAILRFATVHLWTNKMIDWLIYWLIKQLHKFSGVQVEWGYSTYAGHDGSVDVVHDAGPRLRLGRCPVRQQRRQVAGLDLGQHAARTDRLQVVGHVVDHLATSPSELRRIHHSTRQHSAGLVLIAGKPSTEYNADGLMMMPRCRYSDRSNVDWSWSFGFEKPTIMCRRLCPNCLIKSLPTYQHFSTGWGCKLSLHSLESTPPSNHTESDIFRLN